MDLETNRLYQAAVWYANLGYPVFPCLPGQKKPATDHGLLEATTDLEQIERWWTENPNANVGIRTDGLVVIDDDSHSDWLRGQDDRRHDLDAAPASRTARGGMHFVFRQPPGKAWRNTQSKLANKVDTRANGGYIVAPPSVFNNGTYSWIEGRELSMPPSALPEPPAWLIDELDRITAALPEQISTAFADHVIPEGQRNGTLTRLAGTMRRVGMNAAEIAGALHAINAGRCTPPLGDREVERIATSVAEYPPDEVATAIAEGRQEKRVKPPLQEPLAAGELVARFPDLRPPLIEGLLRRGETMNLIAPTKMGKSWLILALAIAVATGIKWLNRFATAAGSVLLIDNELHPETLAHRIPVVAAALGISMDRISTSLRVLYLRGQLCDIFSFRSFFKARRGQYALTILDSFYRFFPPGVDENDNAAMARIFNQIDAYTDDSQSAFALVHHATKGNQAGKAITDVGAGAGSQSRAVDTHLVLRPHEQAGAVVLEAVARSWPQPSPVPLRWNAPLWTLDDQLDVSRLRAERGGRGPKKTTMAVAEFLTKFITDKPQVRDAIIATAVTSGLSQARATGLLKEAAATGRIFDWTTAANRPSAFATRPPPPPSENQT